MSKNEYRMNSQPVNYVGIGRGRGRPMNFRQGRSQKLGAGNEARPSNPSGRAKFHDTEPKTISFSPNVHKRHETQPAAVKALVQPIVKAKVQTPRETINPAEKATILPAVEKAKTKLTADKATVKAAAKPTVQPVVKTAVPPTVKPKVTPAVKSTAQLAVKTTVQPPAVKPKVQHAVKASVKDLVKPLSKNRANNKSDTALSPGMQIFNFKTE